MAHAALDPNRHIYIAGVHEGGLKPIKGALEAAGVDLSPFLDSDGPLDQLRALAPNDHQPSRIGQATWNDAAKDLFEAIDVVEAEIKTVPTSPFELTRIRPGVVNDTVASATGGSGTRRFDQRDARRVQLIGRHELASPFGTLIPWSAFGGLAVFLMFREDSGVAQRSQYGAYDAQSAHERTSPYTSAHYDTYFSRLAARRNF